MLRKYRNDVSDTPKDPDIERWFQALGSPPVAHEPLGARARVLARIEAQQRRGSFAWLSLANPALATGLAAVLLLSIGLNVWWGNHFFGTHLQQTAQVATTEGAASGASSLSIYHFQAQLQQSGELGTLVAARSVGVAPMPMVGFTPEAVPVTTLVRLGTEYTDTLAALVSGQVKVAASHLNVLVQTLDAVQAPPVLSQYLNTMQHVLTQQTYDARTLAQFVALFEALYEAAYAQDSMVDEVILFRAGAWLENLSLAAAVGDKDVLQQTQRVKPLYGVLSRLEVPPTTRHALNQLNDLLTQPALTDQDVKVIRGLVGKIQQGLSA
jgi:hypothetical protein